MTGYIKNYDGQSLTIVAPYSSSYFLEHTGCTECEIILHDGRSISPRQRNKIFAMVSDIADYVSGIDRKKREQREMLHALQLEYLIDTTDKESVRKMLTNNYCQLCGIDLFSLAERSPDTVDMSTARDFIDWLVELCVVHGIPCNDTLLNRCEDVQRYLYACVANRTCAVCGKRADIHEYDRVGMGRNRRKMYHEGQRVQPLCRLHHNEVDQIGQQSFDNKYHMTWVCLDEYLCQILKWKGKKKC